MFHVLQEFQNQTIKMWKKLATLQAKSTIGDAICQKGIKSGF